MGSQVNKMKSLTLGMFSVVYCKGHESKTFRKKISNLPFSSFIKQTFFVFCFFHLKILLLRTEMKGKIICFKRNENLFNHRQQQTEEQPLTGVRGSMLLVIQDLELFASVTEGQNLIFSFVHMTCCHAHSKLRAYFQVTARLQKGILLQYCLCQHHLLSAIIYGQARTKAHNYTENTDCERHMPATKLSLIHSPSRKSQTV